MTDRKRFPGLSSTAFEHPTDKATLAALRKAPGIDWVFRKFNEYGGDRAGRLYCLSDTVRVDKNQCRDLHAMLVECCAVLDMPVPQLYIDQRPFANAFTFCVESPIIVLYSGLIDLLDEDEWRVVLGHELGHIKAGHVLYRQIAEFLANLLMRLGGRTFGLAQGLGLGLFYAFFSLVPAIGVDGGPGQPAGLSGHHDGAEHGDEARWRLTQTVRADGQRGVLAAGAGL